MGEGELSEQFPFLDFTDESTEEEIPTVFIEETDQELVDLFINIYRAFLIVLPNGGFKLDMLIVIPSLQEANLPINESLIKLHSLWSGYNQVLVEKFSGR